MNDLFDLGGNYIGPSSEYDEFGIDARTNEMFNYPDEEDQL